MKNEALYHRDIELNVPSETDREVGKRMLAGARAALEGAPISAIHKCGGNEGEHQSISKGGYTMKTYQKDTLEGELTTVPLLTRTVDGVKLTAYGKVNGFTAEYVGFKQNFGFHPRRKTGEITIQARVGKRWLTLLSLKEVASLTKALAAKHADTLSEQWEWEAAQIEGFLR